MEAATSLLGALRRDAVAYGAILAAGLVALMLGFGPAPALRTAWFTAYGPMLVQLDLLMLMVALGIWLRGLEQRRGLRLARGDAISLAAIGVALLALSLLVPGLMRVQSDESFLVGTAFGMHALHQPVVVHAGFHSPDGIAALIAAPDKRGLLFPILLRVVLGSGFALERAFALNLALAWLLLAGCYAVARRWLAPPSALSAVFVVLSAPVFVWSARSLGFEVLNLCLLAWCVAAATRAAATGDRGALALLVLMAPLLAQARYESVLFGAFAIALVPWLAHARGERLGSLAAVLVVAPFLFLPYAWQRAIPFDDDLAQIGANHAFGLDWLAPHLLGFLRFWVQPSPYNPTGFVVLALAAAALVAAWRRGMSGLDAPLRVAASWAVAVLLVTALILAYAWGDFARPVVVRLGLPVAVLFALAGVAGLVWWRGRYFASRIPELALSGVLLVVSLWSTATDMGYVRGELGPALNEARDWGRSAFPGCRIAYATNSGAFFVEHGWDAIPPELMVRSWPGMSDTARELGIDSVVGVEILSLTRGVVIGAAVPRDLAQFVLEDRRVAPTTRLRLVALDRGDDPLPRGRPHCPHVPSALLHPNAGASAP